MLRTVTLWIVFFTATIALAGVNAYGQSDTTNPGVYEALSLKDLLNVKIVSVSKNAERLFDAPLSASVITKDDIQKAGCTSIMEAMRLVPGMIVREESNGNYDIHLRGMDNVPPNSSFDLMSNTTTLVMIDNRPVYSYLRGGTFWETLPVDLNDVEKIEVIRGPAAALYGPNAVNGVINIITRQAAKDGLYLVANMQQGSDLFYSNNISAGYRFSKKLSMIASGNYQSSDRTQTSYFEFNRNKWLEDPEYFINFNNDTVHNVDQRYPDQPMAMDKYAGNLFVNYAPADKMKFDISMGSQHSRAQRVSTENEITPFSTCASNSRYIDFRANVKGWTAQVSYNSGTQATDLNPGRKYDFHTFNSTLEYNYTKGNLSIRPSLGYTNALCDDTKYSDTAEQTGLLNARGKITTQSASLKAEYKLLQEKLRLVAGGSSTRFNYPDKNYWSYQFAATYKPNKHHLFRVVYSQAPRSSTVFDMYISRVVQDQPIGYNNYYKVMLQPNRNISLMTADMLELGYRGELAEGLTIDVELFDITAKNYNNMIIEKNYVQISGSDTSLVMPVRSMNIPMVLHQQGVTVSLAYSRGKWQAKPFVTIQHTGINNYSPFNAMPDASQAGAQQNNIYSGMGQTSTLNSTPAFFGGASFNYTPVPKVNININTYYYGSQVYYHLSHTLFNDGVRGIDHINAKMIVNARVSYEATKGCKLFCTAKNLLNDNSREFFRSDAIPFMLFGGVNYEF